MEFVENCRGIIEIALIAQNNLNGGTNAENFNKKGISEIC
jgi:hypothetical protein